MLLSPSCHVAVCARLRLSGILSLAFALVLASLLAACGGGGGGSSPTPDLTIISQPADVHVTSGSSASFTVRVSGSASYAWQRMQDGAWTDVPGANAATLTLDDVQTADSGAQFQAVVTSLANAANHTTSSTVTLTVDPLVVAPSITAQPASVSVVESQVASFSVTATGTSLAYRWQRSTGGTAWVDIGGATLTTLTLTAALADNDAYVRAIVGNSLGEVASAAARLNVSPAPQAPAFTTQPVDATILTGQSATFNAVANGAPAPSIDWYESVDGTTWFRLGATGGSYTTPVESTATQQWFRAVATNDGGSTTSATARLTVNTAPSAPTITSQTQGTTIAVGASVLFFVSASGTPAPYFQWQLSTDGGTTFTNVNGATDSTYSIASTTAADDHKIFRVVVANSQGTVTSASMALRVITPLSIRVGLRDAQWRPGQTDGYFLVDVTGTDPQYRWHESSDGGNTYTEVAGATGPGLAIAAATTPLVDHVCVDISNEMFTTSECAALVATHWQEVNLQPTSASLYDALALGGGTWLAVGEGASVMRSIDDGGSWSLAAEDGVSLALRAVAVSGQTGIAVGMSGVIKRSIDGGRHWGPSIWRDNTDWRGVAFNQAGMAVAVGAGVFTHVRTSTDGGVTWQDASNPDSNDNLNAIAFNGAGTGLAVGDNGTIVRSVDGGMTWSRVASGAQSLQSVAFASDDVAVAVGWFGTILRSTDGGLTWSVVTSPTSSSLSSVHFASASLGIAATQGPFLRTVDGGATWSTVATPDTSYSAVRFENSTEAVAVGLAGRIMRSSDGGATWHSLSSGIRSTLTAAAFATPAVGVSVGMGGVILASADAGASWAPVATPGTANLYGVAFADTAVGVAVGDHETVWRTTDAGSTWTQVQANVHAGSMIQYEGVAFASPSVGVIASSAGLVRTADGGLTWQAIGGASFLARAVAFGNPTIGVAVGDLGQLWRTSDAGLTWSRITVPTSDSLNAVTFASSNVVFAVGNAGILTSTDGGATWPAPSLNFAGWYLDAVCFTDASNGVAAGANNTIFATHDGGQTWSLDLFGGNPTLSGVAVAGPSRDSFVAVGSFGTTLRLSAP